MQMQQCPNGHFYNPANSSECPYCTGESSNINATRPQFDLGAAPEIGATMPVDPPSDNHTRAGTSAKPTDNDRTQMVIKKETGIDPVVGWLICVEGKEKGRDYRIHSDNNFIGRGEKMDICIRGDDTISRENHAIISFDIRDKVYYFSPGEGRSIVRVNDKAIFSTVQLAAYDRIELGTTKLLFLPLCGEVFSWTD